MKHLYLKIVTLFICLGTFVNQASAQSDKVSFGIKAGLSLTTLGSATNGGMSASFSYKPGLQAGIFYDIPLGKEAIFSPQLLYTQKGGKIVDGNLFGIRYNSTTSLDYLDIPLLFAYKASPTFRIYAGPQVSLLLSHKTTVTAGGQSSVSDDNNMFKSPIVGANVGLGFDITEILNLNANYILDLANAGKKQYDEGERNSGFLITLGVRF